MSRLFLSYRRSDAPDTVKLIHDRLTARLPRWQVFYDHVSIEPGEVFSDRLRGEVTSATVVLVVIGPRWLAELNRRLGTPTDHVREEIRVALASGRTVVPVTVQNAPLPGESDLAAFPDLLPIPSLNARGLRPDPDFDADLDRLIAFLEPLGPSVDVGTVLAGKYKLVQPVGEGGMGVVFRAEQIQPKRSVAVKLIKPGMDSKEVLARFDTERQALALMDHPNIARVIDAGATPAGRPFFVMDFVKGGPITDYCDDKKLPLAERLALFCRVCDAVQHAHQKGIIHRDIKPSNVLVEVVDGRPVPKVIDFGLAKAMSHRLTDKTFVSEAGKTVGTLPYSSPEQAAGKVFDVDTRTDIYSLGALLYELLAGTPPFTAEELRAAGEEAMKNIIRENEPPVPSTKLGSSLSLPSIAANRYSDPAKLTRQLRGELDWIVMKAIEKEPPRRYATATSLADDVQRFLNNEPVTAGKPTTVHRLRKFVRRNRGPVGAVAAVFLVLLLGIGGTTVGVLEARLQAGKAIESAAQERAAKEKEKAAKELAERRFAELEKANGVISSLVLTQDPLLPYEEQLPADVALARRLDEVAPKIDEVSGGDPLVRAKLQLAFGTAWVSIREPRKAETPLTQALAVLDAQLGPDAPETLEAAYQTARCLADLRKYGNVIAILEPMIVRLAKRHGPEHQSIDNARYLLGHALIYSGKPAEGLREVEAVVDRRVRTYPPGDERVVTYQLKLWQLYRNAGEIPKRMKLFGDLLKILKPENSDSAGLVPRTPEFGTFAEAVKNIDKLEPWQATQKVYLALRKRLGPYHSGTCFYAVSYLDKLLEAGQNDEAIAFGEEFNRTLRDRYGDDHFLSLLGATQLGLSYMAKNDVKHAQPLMERAAAGFARETGPGSRYAIECSSICAACVAANGDVPAGLKRLRETVALSVKFAGPSDPVTIMVKERLAQLLEAAKEYKEAIQVTTELQELATTQHGPDSVAALRYQQMLAGRYREGNDPEKASALYEDALRRAVQKLGPDAAMSKSLVRTTASFYTQMGSGPKQPNVPMLRRAVASRSASLGADHLVADNARRILASTLVQSERTREEGTRLFEEVIARSRKRGPEARDDLHDQLATLAIAYMDDANSTKHSAAVRTEYGNKAIACMTEAMRLPADATPVGAARKVRDQAALAGAQAALGQNEAAIQTLEAARAGRDSALPVLGEQTFIEMNSALREAYRETGNYAKAVEVVKDSYELWQRVKTRTPMDLAVALADLVDAHIEADLPKDALRLADELTDAKLAALPDTDKRWVRVLWYLASAYTENQRYERAVALYDRAATKLEGGGFKDVDSAGLLRDYGRCQESAGNLAAAEKLQRQVVNLSRRENGAESEAYSTALSELALYLTRQKKWADVEAAARECLTIREKLVRMPRSGVKSWQVANTKSMLGEAIDRQGKPGEAEPLLVEGFDVLLKEVESIPASVRRTRLSEGAGRLVRFYAAAKREAEGLKVADRFAEWAEKLTKDIDDASYDAACYYAVSVRKDKPDEVVVTKTLALLAKCRDAGFFKDAANVKLLDEDEDLRTVREHPKFVEFARSLKR